MIEVTAQVYKVEEGQTTILIFDEHKYYIRHKERKDGIISDNRNPPYYNILTKNIEENNIVEFEKEDIKKYIPTIKDWQIDKNISRLIAKDRIIQLSDKKFKVIQ